MTTIISAFIANGNTYRTEDTYLTYIQDLLNIDIPKIIFLENKIIERLQDLQNSKTIFVPFEREDLLLFPFINSGLKIPEANLKKDTLEYLMIQINKTEWVRKAIEMNPYKSGQFMWVDCGIYHIFSDQRVFIDCIKQAASRTYNNLRIGVCDETYRPNNLSSQLPPNSPAFNRPIWFFAGGVFGGPKNKLLLFADRVRDKAMQFIAAGHLTWEINIWYTLYFGHEDSFNIYLCNHDKSILKNY